MRFANEPVPPQPGEAYVAGIGGIAGVLDARVIASGGLVRPVSTSCGTHRIKPAFTCRITYLSHVVTYRVTAAKTRGSYYAWQARPDVLVATRGGIEAAMWRTYASRASAMSCDASLPPVQVVHPRTTLRQRCYFRPAGARPDWGARSRNGGKTVAVPITIDDSKSGLDVVTQ